MAMDTPFRFGIVSEVTTREEWVALARRSEALGYSTLLVGEHPSFGGTGPIAAAMAAAAATTSLRVGWHVLANGFRNPVLLAQEAATIDVLSGGRLKLGIGAGWLRTDYDALGIPFPPPGVRVDRLAEAIPLIKRLLGTEAVTHTGAHYQVQDLDLMPKPLQHPHPPLFVGGAGRRMLSLAAREADIVSLDAASTVEGTKDLGFSHAGRDSPPGGVGAASRRRPLRRAGAAHTSGRPRGDARPVKRCGGDRCGPA